MKFLLIVTISILSICALVHGGINENNDFQLWIYDSFNKKIADKTTLYVDWEIRYGDDASTLYLYYAQARCMFDLSQRLSIAPSYRQQRVMRTSDRKWRSVSEPFIDIHLKFKIKDWQFNDRNRPSFIFFEDRPNVWQYRNRLTVNSPWKLGKMKFNPLFFDEIFFRERVGFFENRFGIGGSIATGKKSKATVVYVLRHIEIAEIWRNTHVIWLLIDLGF